MAKANTTPPITGVTPPPLPPVPGYAQAERHGGERGGRADRQLEVRRDDADRGERVTESARDSQAGRAAEHAGDERDQRRFGADQLADLFRRRGDRAQQRELPPPL